MNHIRRKFALFLSDPSISASELKSFARWLKNGGLDECVTNATEIRRILDALRVHDAIENDGARSLEDKVAERIRQLLLVEANLQSDKAMSLLSKKLGVSGPIIIKPLEKVVEKLVANYGGSSVLSAAQQLRNDFVHGTHVGDWPLKDSQ